MKCRCYCFAPPIEGLFGESSFEKPITAHIPPGFSLNNYNLSSLHKNPFIFLSLAAPVIVFKCKARRRAVLDRPGEQIGAI